MNITRKLPLSTVAWWPFKSKKIQGSTFSIGVGLSKLDVRSCKRRRCWKRSLVWCHETKSRSMSVQLLQRSSVPMLSQACGSTVKDPHGHSTNMRKRYWRCQWCWGGRCCRFWCQRRHADGSQGGNRATRKLLVNQPVREGGGSMG